MDNGADPHTADDRVLIVGAGPAGLATAWRLERLGVPAEILERNHTVASSWHSYYEGVQLFTTRRISSLPGKMIPRKAGPWPRRQALIEYYDAYAARLRTPIRFGVEVKRVDRDGDGWLVQTSDGPRRARWVVMATGLFATPIRPHWPGERGFTGQLISSDEYGNGAPFRDKEVLVVGAGLTGTDIAFDLYHWGARRIDVAMRNPPRITPTKFMGVPVQYINTVAKRDWFPNPLYNRLSKGFHRLMPIEFDRYFDHVPRVSWGHVEMYEGPRSHSVNFNRSGVTLIKQRKVGLVGALEAFDGDDVLLADGTRMNPDVVIIAIGRKPQLEPLVGHLGLLGVHGRPLVHGRRTWPTAPNLFFIGYRMPPAQLPDIRLDSRAICRRIASEAGSRAQYYGTSTTLPTLEREESASWAAAARSNS